MSTKRAASPPRSAGTAYHLLHHAEAGKKSKIDSVETVVGKQRPSADPAKDPHGVHPSTSNSNDALSCDAHFPLDRLPIDILQHLVSFWSVHARLRVVSFVCKRWRTAVLRSITEASCTRSGIALLPSLRSLTLRESDSTDSWCLPRGIQTLIASLEDFNRIPDSSSALSFVKHLRLVPSSCRWTSRSRVISLTRPRLQALSHLKSLSLIAPLAEFSTDIWTALSHMRFPRLRSLYVIGWATDCVLRFLHHHTGITALHVFSTPSVESLASVQLPNLRQVRWPRLGNDIAGLVKCAPTLRLALAKDETYAASRYSDHITDLSFLLHGSSYTLMPLTMLNLIRDCHFLTSLSLLGPTQEFLQQFLQAPDITRITSLKIRTEDDLNRSELALPSLTYLSLRLGAFARTTFNVPSVIALFLEDQHLDYTSLARSLQQFPALRHVAISEGSRLVLRPGEVAQFERLLAFIGVETLTFQLKPPPGLCFARTHVRQQRDIDEQWSIRPGWFTS